MHCCTFCSFIIIRCPALAELQTFSNLLMGRNINESPPTHFLDFTDVRSSAPVNFTCAVLIILRARAQVRTRKHTDRHRLAVSLSHQLLLHWGIWKHAHGVHCQNSISSPAGSARISAGWESQGWVYSKCLIWIVIIWITAEAHTEPASSGQIIGIIIDCHDCHAAA